MAANLAIGNYTTRCRCGKFATVLTETDTIRRVECATCGTQTLYGKELRT